MFCVIVGYCPDFFVLSRAHYSFFRRAQKQYRAGNRGQSGRL
jgi:hypothetical protein